MPIEVCQLNNLLGLNLGNNRLHSLPWEVCGLQSLQALNLGNNQLQELPPSIGRLLSLLVLDLYNNQLKARLPPSPRLPLHPILRHTHRFFCCVVCCVGAYYTIFSENYAR